MKTKLLLPTRMNAKAKIAYIQRRRVNATGVPSWFYDVVFPDGVVRFPSLQRAEMFAKQCGHVPARDWGSYEAPR